MAFSGMEVSLPLAAQARFEPQVPVAKRRERRLNCIGPADLGFFTAEAIDELQAEARPRPQAAFRSSATPSELTGHPADEGRRAARDEGRRARRQARRLGCLSPEDLSRYLAEVVDASDSDECVSPL
eukprot:CAMPEP_0115330660 /NCGR_PEP_ID=MMETSP0270-20121206/85893_1 /TAXON_ID=71861 /ORGANISM="Scrippsiella trochoidea, Strain CCMP3099" /LENGTH=126 /DNA_ID=CAMNT_0002751385 /DNA_START=6 /DNA_END=386 /DNA_ORIENTATION=-